MQIAIDVAGFSPTEADELRQAMSAKRSGERMAAPARPALRRHGRPGRVRGGVRAGVHGAGRLRQLRLPREPLGGLRPPGVRHGLVQGALPGRLHRRTAQRPAHGLLVPPEPGGRRQAPRGGGAAARRRPRTGRRVPRAGRTASRVRTRGRHRPCGSGCPRCAASARTPPSGSPRGRPGRAWRTWCAGPGSPGPSSRHWPRRAPSTAWGRAGRGGRGTAPAGGRWCGGRGRPPRPRPTGCPGVVTGAEPPPLPGPDRVGGGGRRPVVARHGPRHHRHGAGPGRARPARGGAGRRPRSTGRPASG